MKKLFIEDDYKYIRAALKEDDILKSLVIQKKDELPKVGEIYIGIVKNIVKSTRCAFIDIGKEKNCYMYLNNLNDLRQGDNILVEVIKESIGTKEAKVSNEISIQGDYCVLVTFNNKINLSKKINNLELRNIIYKNVKKPFDIGIIIRSNVLESDIEKVNNEIKELYSIYLKILNKNKYSLKPKLLYNNGNFVYKLFRNQFNFFIDEIITNSCKCYETINEYKDIKDGFLSNLKLYDNKVNLFSFYDIEKEILKLKNNKINLKSEGYIIIDKTEALYAIDVNSGKNTKHKSMKETVLNTNLEAAAEIANQIKLRNLGGIIIIDFIDMYDLNDKNQVLNLMNENFKYDKNNTKIYPFTELGLVQITRKRIGEDVNEYIQDNCDKCFGNGKIIKFEYIKFLIKNNIYDLEKKFKLKDICIEINEIYKKNISYDIFNFVKDIDALDKTIYVIYTNHDDIFKVEPLMFNSQIKKLENCKIYG